MKKVLICSVASMAILLACATGMTEEAKKDKARGDRGKASAQVKRTEKKELSEAEKQWREKLAAMTPEQRRIAIANKALADDLAPWKQVRAVAVEEKATKTVAAIDKIISAKTEQHKKKLEAIAKSREGEGGKPKNRSDKKGEQEKTGR